VDRAGIEPATHGFSVCKEYQKTPPKTTISPAVDTDFDTTSPSLVDPDLARIIEAWPQLPDPIRRAVLALIG
jgi:hypothetical protein